MRNIRTRLKTFIQKMGPWGFPLIYIGWAYLFWSPLFASEASVWSFPKVLFFLIGGASPLIAAIVFAGLKGGRQHLRELVWRLIDVRRIGLRWFIVIVLFWPVFDVLMAGAAVVLGVTNRPLGIVLEVVTSPRTLIFMLLLSFVFPAVEEIGLRGYWLDELQERFSPPLAGLINGSAWAIWHTPFIWFPGYYANTTFHPALWWWLPSIVLQTLLIVWI